MAGKTSIERMREVLGLFRGEQGWGTQVDDLQAESWARGLHKFTRAQVEAALRVAAQRRKQRDDVSPMPSMEEVKAAILAATGTPTAGQGCGKCDNGLRLIVGVFEVGPGKPLQGLQCWFRCPCTGEQDSQVFAVDEPGRVIESKAPMWKDRETGVERCQWNLLGTWVQQAKGEQPPDVYQVPGSERGQRHWYGADAPLPEPWVASKGNSDISQAVREIGERMHPT